ncbi:odorant receptor 13a-like [Ptiloglossa arizonensis]|uniref:odorant receptor 13a-like n=1 Tax=Ptiloglossa arizonensis TaxID=3350558 RepID=UPI003FA0ED83
MTPYYEIIFVIETFLALHVGVCFCCFDNFFYTLCIHVSGQFEILQHNLRTILVRIPLKEKRVIPYDKFVNCVEHHNLLISFVQKLEYTFCYPNMGQLLISSIMLCTSGFQLCLVSDHENFLKRLLYVTYFFGGLIQIFLITMNSNNIIVQSNAVGDAVYQCSWETSSCELYDKLRKNILIIMIRSHRPSYLTAAKFFSISLESFTKVIAAIVLGTTASYFTLLRQFDVKD